MDDPGGESAEVQEQVDELHRELEGLRLENEVFRNYLERSEPAADDESAPAEGKKALRARRRNLPQKLTMEQKCEIATLEHDRLVQDASDGRRASERLADTLRAVLEETDLRISELKKDAYEFKRDIVVGAENMRTGKTVAEKMIKYMEEKLRQRDSAIEKLRLKNSSLKAQLQKVEAQLKQKEEMGDVLHYIDFHQLQIENKQFQITIELRNKELLDLKLTTGKTVQALNALKGRLTTVEKESSQLTTDISLKNDQLKKVLDDSDGVANDVSLEQRARQRLGQAAAAQDAPSTMDYIAQKAAMYDLETLVKNWGRKCEILEMHAKRVRSQLRKEARTA